jgi:hypothetical protein
VPAPATSHLITATGAARFLSARFLSARFLSARFLSARFLAAERLSAAERWPAARARDPGFWPAVTSLASVLPGSRCRN